MINFGTRTSLKMATIHDDVYLDIVNLDHYDMVMGVPLMVQLGICLDFDQDMIRMRGGENIPLLKIEEEKPTTTRRLKSTPIQLKLAWKE